MKEIIPGLWIANQFRDIDDYFHWLNGFENDITIQLDKKCFNVVCNKTKRLVLKLVS